MYIWLGIDVNDQLGCVGEAAKDIEGKLGFENSNFTLPLHISLKMSFQVSAEKYDLVIRDICDVFSSTEEFSLDVQGIENEISIIWIMMERNTSIDSLHDRLNDMLLMKYGVPLHEYDCDYKFHTTLFMDSDTEKMEKAYEMISESYVPSKLKINKFLVGASETGDLGTFKIIKEIKVK